MAELTKYGTHSEIRIPPESTGSRVHHHVRYSTEVNGLVPLIGSLPWRMSSSNGSSGFVTSVGDIQSSINKRISIVLDNDSIINGFSAGDILTLTNQSGQTSCTVVSFEAINTPAVAIAGGGSPDNFLNVDVAGSAYVRFTEGEQQLDPKGLTRITTPTPLMDIKFVESTNDSTVHASITGTASQTFIYDERLLALDIGTSSTDAIKKRTNRYCFFQGGFSSIFESTVAIGDQGKANVVRRWGYYDDSNGLFFELNGLELFVVIRSSVTGSVVDTRIPQSQWNVDKLNGTATTDNVSGIRLNVSNMNYYFIDFPGSSSGRVRFGVYSASGRIVCHQEFFGNNLPTNFMRTALLPMTWEQFNTGLSASPSRMKTLGGSVLNEGFQTPESQVSISRNFTWVQPTTATHTGTDWKHILTTRSGKFIPNTGNTIINRKSTIPQKLAYHITGGPVILQIRAGVVLDGVPNFTQAAFGSPAEVDTAGLFPTNVALQGMPLMTRMYAPGQYTIDPPQSFNIRGQALSLRSDGEYGLAYSFVFRPLNPSDNVAITVALDWIDL